MYVSGTTLVTGGAGAAGLALTGRNSALLAMVGLTLIILGMLLIRAATVRRREF
jgi:hypothetical protein